MPPPMITSSAPRGSAGTYRIGIGLPPLGSALDWLYEAGLGTATLRSLVPRWRSAHVRPRCWLCAARGGDRALRGLDLRPLLAEPRPLRRPAGSPRLAGVLVHAVRPGHADPQRAARQPGHGGRVPAADAAGQDGRHP